MEVTLIANVASAPDGGPAGVTAGEGQVEFRCPQELREAGFPHGEVRFPFDHITRDLSPGDLQSRYLSSAALKLFERQNTVVFAAGQRATPKRQMLFGPPGKPDGGAVWKVMKGVCEASQFKSLQFKACAYAVSHSESITDMLDLENTSGIMRDSLKGPPSVKGITIVDVKSWADGQKVLRTINKNYVTHFESVLSEPRETPFANYNPDNLVFALRAYVPDVAPDDDDAAAADAAQRPGEDRRTEINSLHFIVLGDSERPALCGIDTAVMKRYEDTQKTLSAIIGVLGAIRCNRLRVPFGKCRLTHLLKRAYNAEKANQYNEGAKPTQSIIVSNVFETDRYSEEAFHSLTFSKRIMNVIGGGAGIGPASRDLAVEKWRLEQDIVELKDELDIAKSVHGYKPCIFNPQKQVQNIKEEEQKRTTKIREQRDKQREERVAEMQRQATEEARAYIDKEQQRANQNLQELQKKLDRRLAENQGLMKERDTRMQQLEREIEKIRKKRADEERKTQELRHDIEEIESTLTARQDVIQKKRQELELLNKDHTKGREMILQGRAETKQKRDQLGAQRVEQRRNWLKEIKETNEKVLHQIRQLEETRKNRSFQAPQDAEEETEQSVCEDIESIDRFLPRLISIEDAKGLDAKAEEVRQQLEDYFDSERKSFEEKLLQEQARREELERASATYKSRISEQQNKVKKDQLTEAMKKERHLEGLIEQVIQYLEHGCRMTKIPSKGSARKRYFFICEDRKRIMACEMDDMGMPVNRKRPTSTVYFRDIKRIVLGQFTQSFKNFEKEGGKSPMDPGDVLDDDEGAYNPSPTQVVTPANIGKYFYRSFSFEFKKGKSLDVVTETDSDFEAWIVALKRLLGSKTEWEKVQDPKKGGAYDDPPTVEWGVPLDVTQKPGVERLMQEEMQLCADNHITPMQFVNSKTEIINKSQNSFVTVYDVRTLSSLDLLRSRVVYDYFVRKKLIGSPNTADIR
eukprot:TRINITY_DN47048_c0_g1_i1.p1 TRINITY_DN47048_c0_g1~~TRINITY_DN47048_c0_g1_i1.p1  ORF type:complete len:1004 (+),score=466.05 TRINITY_DN47048_c0_g1_i1:85-3012(+)